MKPSEILTTQPITPRWVVQDMIPCGTMVIIAGEAGAGKSTLMYCLIYALASGRPFLGHPTAPMRVLYFDEENSAADFLQYNQWAWIGAGQAPLEHLDALLRIEHFTLQNGWIALMDQAIREHQPGLIIVDTASSAFNVRDENDNSEAIRVIRQLRALRALAGPDASMVILKHEKQRSETSHRRTIRGAKVWLGAFDQVLFHTITRGRRRKDGTRKTILEPEKMRAFSLRSAIGIDPSFTDAEPKGLILNTFNPTPTPDEG